MSVFWGINPKMFKSFVRLPSLKNNSSPLKINAWKMTCSFRGRALNLREGTRGYTVDEYLMKELAGKTLCFVFQFLSPVYHPLFEVAVKQWKIHAFLLERCFNAAGKIKESFFRPLS